MARVPEAPVQIAVFTFDRFNELALYVGQDLSVIRPFPESSLAA